MISRQHNVVFVHIPKAAGQSIEQAFLDDLGLSWGQRGALLLRPNDDPRQGPPRLAHLSAREYVELGHVSQQEWASFFRFAVVREPYERAVSLYRHLGPDLTFDDWVATWLRSTLFDEEGAWGRWFVRPQAEFLLSEGKDLMVPNLIRFENLPGMFAEIALKIGLTRETLPIRNRTTDKPKPYIEGKPTPLGRLVQGAKRRIAGTAFQTFQDWRVYYSSQSALHIKDLYAEDFAHFDYPTEFPG